MNIVKQGNSIDLIKEIDNESIDLILSDIPYGINYDEWDIMYNNTNSALLKENPIHKQAGGIFKKRGKPLNGWSEADKMIPRQYYEWCMSWSYDWFRVLKPGSTCFIFAGRRMAHRCIVALEDAGFIFKDMLAWEKDSAVYRAQRVSSVFERRNDYDNMKKWEGWKIGNLRPLFEPILWFMKPYPIGKTLTDNIIKNNLGAFNETSLKNNDRLLNSGLKACSNILQSKSTDTDRGLHPTQKSVALMETLIELVTVSGQIVLDPFCGCGTTLLAAKNLDRKYIGFEINKNYYHTVLKRLSSA